KYWDGLYPLPDEEGIDTRTAPLTGLNGDDAEGTLIAPINKVPITDNTSVGRLSTAHYQEASNLAKITDPKVKEKRLARGAVAMETFLKAVAESPPKFYTNLVEDLTQSLDEYGKLCGALDKRCDGRAPPSSNIRGALTGCLDAIKGVAQNKLAM